MKRFLKIMAAALAMLLFFAAYGCGSFIDDSQSNNGGSDKTSGSKTSADGESNNGDAENEAYKVKKTLADFRYGVAFPYDKYTKLASEGWTSWQPKTFESRTPAYSYLPLAADEEKEYKTTCEWYSAQSDEDCNYYTIYPSASNSTSGEVSALLRFYIPPLQEEDAEFAYGGYPAEYTNYLDLSEYDVLRFTFSCTSSDGSDVRYKVNLKNHGGKTYTIYEYSGKGGKQVISADVSKIEATNRDKLESIEVVNVIENMPRSQTLLCKWYKIEALAKEYFNTKEADVKGLSVKSEYLGNMFYMYGAYSGSGFYDKADEKYKVWFGACVPEEQSSDNIYYTEATDPEGVWSKPVRITTDDTTGHKLIDESGKLRGSSSPIGYGGDPSVIKVNGTYYMYFSGLEWNLNDGKYTHWNKIWLATSTDGKTWYAKGAVADSADGGTLGYGAGGPCAVYKDGTFYLYYYSQSYDPRYPGEPGGLVLKRSKDGINFDRAISIDRSMSTLDVRYVPELMKWIGTYYSEENQFAPDTRAGVRIAVSEDGIVWEFDHSDNSLIAQDLNIPLNHNPGFIGTEEGWAGTTLYCMYGANDLPLTVNGKWFSSAQYDARQMEFTKIYIN